MQRRRFGSAHTHQGSHDEEQQRKNCAVSTADAATI